MRSFRGFRMIIGGDFNAHSAEWECPSDDHRGFRLSELAAEQDLVTCNLGNTPTYRRRNAASTVDVTFARLEFGMTIQDWRVLTHMNSKSDHQYISYVMGRLNHSDAGQRTELPGWSIKKIDHQKLKLLIKDAPHAFSVGDHAEAKAEILGDCSPDSAMA